MTVSAAKTPPGAAPTPSYLPIILAASIILALSFGARSIFGVVLAPLSSDLGWPRETFALSLALQNLIWGLGQPFFGAVADRIGDRKALWIGLLCYLAGMLISAVGTAPWMQHLGVGFFVGLGTAGTAFGLVLAAVGRAVPEAKRSRALALVAALGASGQVLMPLLAQAIEASQGWQLAIAATGALLLLAAFAIPFMRAPASGLPRLDPDPMGVALANALRQPSYVLLNLGFFVCGFHVAFISAHFPAYVAEVCRAFTLMDRTVSPEALGAATLSITGAANIAGTLLAGELGARYPKPYVLSGIYALRALLILAFLALPATPASVIAFSALMGILWLSTVPLTSALVATMFGPRNLATLSGVVFLSHQLGSFLGVWMGGRFYDLYGSYDTVWMVAIGLGIFSAIVHLPISERRLDAAPA
ncbi:MAG: MFS transporter [Pseudomonadota bacterium]